MNRSILIFLILQGAVSLSLACESDDMCNGGQCVEGACDCPVGSAGPNCSSSTCASDADCAEGTKCVKPAEASGECREEASTQASGSTAEISIESLVSSGLQMTSCGLLSIFILVTLSLL